MITKQLLMLTCLMAQGTIMCMKTPAKALATLDADLSALGSHAKWLNIKNKMQERHNKAIELMSLISRDASQAISQDSIKEMQDLELLYQNKIDTKEFIERNKKYLRAFTQKFKNLHGAVKNLDQTKQERGKILHLEMHKIDEELENRALWPSQKFYDEYQQAVEELDEFVEELHSTT